LRVGIIGAGVGGLTAALALHLAGFEAEVFDAREAPDDADHALALAANATRVLRALQVLDAVEAVATRPIVRHLRGWRSSYIVGFVPLGGHHEARYGAPFVALSHAALTRILLEAVRARGIAVHWQARCHGVAQTTRHAAARFADAEHHYDALIGSDGAGSEVRTALFDTPPPAAGARTVCWGIAPTKPLPAMYTMSAETLWLGPHQHVWHVPLEGGAALGFTAMLPATEQPYTATSLRAAFTRWHADLRVLFDHVATFRQQRLASWQPPPSCAVGRIALLGDACNPILPSLAHGAAAAIEDAWVLARLLEDAEDDPLAALEEYQFYRSPRRRRLQVEAERFAAWCENASPWGRLLRNLRLGLGSRLLPELVSQDRDWLEGYDAIKGFG
jgi:salicylate hydroxylase